MRLQLGERYRRNARVALAVALFGILAVAAVIGAILIQRNALKAPVQTQNVPARDETNALTAVLNMEGASSTRGAEASGPTKTNGLQRLPRARISALLIYLPFGSPPGNYQLYLRRSGGVSQSPLATFSGPAEIKDGLTVLKLSLDLSTYSPGIYAISVLRDGTALWSCQFRLS